MELAVVKYIKEHGLEKTIEDFSLKMREYEHVIILKYDQLASPMSAIEVQESRGLILDKNDWSVQAMAFMKFFNNAEGNAAKINWANARILAKLDGCLHHSTILQTEDGDKTIKEICDTKYDGKVLSYNLETKKNVFDQIIGHSVKENIDNWYEIELEDGTILKVTDNHKIFLPNLNCYREVSDLKVGDFILKK